MLKIILMMKFINIPANILNRGHNHVARLAFASGPRSQA